MICLAKENKKNNSEKTGTCGVVYYFRKESFVAGCFWLRQRLIKNLLDGWGMGDNDYIYVLQCSFVTLRSRARRLLGTPKRVAP
jgi:hypothetical protein